MNKRLLFYYLAIIHVSVLVAQEQMNEILYGVAYYDEYMPYDRLDQDIQMMKDAGLNFVRIAESTWSTVEPHDNQFDFSHIDRVLDAMHAAGIKVVVGTPTYAVPSWLVKKYPEILAITPSGQRLYGARQNMDISNKNFRFHAERVIRKIMEHVKDHPAIIGYQVDNETKAYKTSGPNVQKAFVEHMKNKFTLNELNKAYGLDYWSNRINSWEDFPSVNGTINASLKSAFEQFQRGLVTEYLAWQTAIVKEYSKPYQFVTQNFDLEWRGYSYGIQPEVDHFEAAKSLDIAGVDIYHPSQDELTGIEISLAGDLARSMKGGKNYFVVETEAQGFRQWVPYPNQLRLQAYSHLASGANMVAYWHWHSIHNSAETYWKGLLSHDFKPNPTYDESKIIGHELKNIGRHLVNLKKNNDVAILFSNEALSAFNAFKFGWGTTLNYNDVLRPYYDALYELNVGVDFIDSSVDFEMGSNEFGKYKMIIVPALYSASDKLLQKLNEFVANGGHVIITFKSGFSDENVKVRVIDQPGLLSEMCGVTYNQFVDPKGIGLKDDPFKLSRENKLLNWMELLKPTTAEVIANYDHPYWGRYAAITQNKFKKGMATYVGAMMSKSLTKALVKDCLLKANLLDEDLIEYPIIKKHGTNALGKKIRYYFNYSATEKQFTYAYDKAFNLHTSDFVSEGDEITIPAWGVVILESK